MDLHSNAYVIPTSIPVPIPIAPFAFPFNTKHRGVLVFKISHSSSFGLSSLQVTGLRSVGIPIEAFGTEDLFVGRQVFL